MTRPKKHEQPRKKPRRLKKKASKLTAAENKFAPLSAALSPTDVVPHQDTEIILLDSGDDENDQHSVIVVSEDETPFKEDEESKDNNTLSKDKDVFNSNEDPLTFPSKDEASTLSNGSPGANPRKRRYSETQNEVSGNQDFIGFGADSSSDEDNADDAADENDYSDDGYISNDDQGVHSFASEKILPWVKGQDHSKQKEIADWLTLEIKDFVNYISPSKEEITIRNTVINNLKSNISSFWPSTQAHVFGSCATDLYLPGSDIDMVIISTTGDYEQRSRLYQLSSFLRTNRLAKNIQVIATAKVPIIKFVDPDHNINVDISFERSNGLDAARRIRKWLDLTPGLRELVLIIKQFLRSRRLNDVHVGGLGGYSTIILVYHFLKLHPRISTGNLNAMENLGTLLIEFFELYGMNFSYDKLVIALNNGDDSPKYLLKTACPQLGAVRGQFTLVIQDPSDPANNITRSSYNLRGIKKAFVGAFQLLISKCYELNGATYKVRLGALILGDIIKFKGKDRDFNDDRDKVVNHALINHDSDSESDGADGNDKYYLSDMTDENVDDTSVLDTPTVVKLPPRVANIRSARIVPTPKLASKGNLVTAAPKSVSPKPNSRTDKKRVEDFISLEKDSDDEAAVPLKRSKSSSSSIDKDSKRDYWALKGLGV